MKNPFVKSDMFATPESEDALLDYIQRFSGGERIVAFAVAMMTMNLAHDEVEKAINGGENGK